MWESLFLLLAVCVGLLACDSIRGWAMWGHHSQWMFNPPCAASSTVKVHPRALRVPGTQGTLVLSQATPICWNLCHFYGGDTDPLAMAEECTRLAFPAELPAFSSLALRPALLSDALPSSQPSVNICKSGLTCEGRPCSLFGCHFCRRRPASPSSPPVI